jgi:hypothetical protein
MLSSMRRDNADRLCPASDTGNKKANPKAGLIIEDFF